MAGTSRQERQAHSGHRRNKRIRARTGGDIPASKRHRLARKKGAAEGSRREHSKRAGGHNSNYRWDFGVRGPPHATARFPIAERRSSGCRSRCGRHTSHPGETSARCAQYSAFQMRSPLRPWPLPRDCLCGWIRLYPSCRNRPAHHPLRMQLPILAEGAHDDGASSQPELGPY